MIDDLVLGAQHGTLWTRDSATQITVGARQTSHPGVIPLRGADGTLVPLEITPSGLSGTMAAWGSAGALLDGDAETTIGYDVFVVAKALGVDARIAFLPRGDGLTFANLATWAGSAYTLKSPVVSFANNSAGDIAPYWQADGEGWYLDDFTSHGVGAGITAQGSDTPIALDWTDEAPSENTGVLVAMHAENTTSSARNLYIYRETGATNTLWQWNDLATTAGRTRSLDRDLWLAEHNGPGGSAHVRWSGSVGGSAGASFYCRGWRLGGRQ